MSPIQNVHVANYEVKNLGNKAWERKKSSFQSRKMAPKDAWQRRKTAFAQNGNKQIDLHSENSTSIFYFRI